jgi:hypothetical protein
MGMNLGDKVGRADKTSGAEKSRRPDAGRLSLLHTVNFIVLFGIIVDRDFPKRLFRPGTFRHRLFRRGLNPRSRDALTREVRCQSQGASENRPIGFGGGRGFRFVD